jgi:hypothetical protein
VAKGGFDQIVGGGSQKLKLKLTKKAKKYLRKRKPKLKGYMHITSAEVAESTVEKAKAVSKHKRHK